MMWVSDGVGHSGPNDLGISLSPPGPAVTSCGSSMRAAYRQFGVYAGRTLRGEKPANLPDKFELIN